MAKIFWLKRDKDKKNVAQKTMAEAENQAPRGRPSKNCIFRVKF